MKQEIRFCTSFDGTRLAYAVSGSGPPVVKAANWLSHLEYEWDSPVWRHWFRDLSQKYTLIRYDQRGCGLSDREVEDISFDAWVRDLDAVVRAAGVQDFSLLGLSQGGAVAAAYAAAHPEAVTALVLCGSYLRGRNRRNLPKAGREETRVLSQIITMGWGKDNPAFRQVFTTLFLPDADPTAWDALNRLHTLSTSPETAQKIVACFDDIDIGSLAGTVACPALVLHARGDARVPFEEGRLAAAVIPGATFVPLESQNHILQKDEPAWAAFNEALDTFMPGDAGAVLPGRRFSCLTPREREVMGLVAEGLSNDEIGAQLFISPKTVRNHITHIFAKLDIRHRAQAVVMARQAGTGHF